MQDFSLEEENSEERVGLRQRLTHSALHVLKGLLYILTLPYSHCRVRSHPRIVPDYSLLVFVTYLANPPLGLLVCYLHEHTKNMYLRNQRTAADVLYIFIIIISHVIIGVTLICVCLTIAYYVISRQRQPFKCIFNDRDFSYMEHYGLGEAEYCRNKMRGDINFHLPPVDKPPPLVDNGCPCP